MKQIIRLTESDLHRIVKRSVNKILKEGYGVPDPSDFLDVEPGNMMYDRFGNPLYDENGDPIDDEEDDEPFDFDETYYGGR